MNKPGIFFFAATNPCHTWDQARGLAANGTDTLFYSGYPTKRLGGSSHGCSIIPFSIPTYVTYGLTKYLGRSGRFAEKLYRIQDITFDRASANYLRKNNELNIEAVIGVPGQCLELFSEAKERGIKTFLNHASGPEELQNETISKEAKSLNFGEPPLHRPIHSKRRISKERDLSDYHIVASSIVREQLLSLSILEDFIITAPYGVDSEVFSKNSRKRENSNPFKAIFAGQADFRKGIHWLIESWIQLKPENSYHLDFYGPSTPWLNRCLERAGKPKNIQENGPIDQSQLAEKMRSADVLILPSIEDAFGLVIPQSLQSGTPVIVSDRVGARDLLTKPEHGHIVKYGDSSMLLNAIKESARSRSRVQDSFDYTPAAAELKSELLNATN